MKERLSKCMEENRSLQERISTGAGEGSGAAQASTAGSGAEIGNLLRFTCIYLKLMYIYLYI